MPDLEKRRKYHRQYYLAHNGANRRRYDGRSKNRREYQRQWTLEHPEIVQAWLIKNKDKLKAYSRKRREINRKSLNEYHNLWRARNLERCRQQERARRAKRYRFDSNFRIEKSLRARFTRALQGRLRADSTLKLLGCPLDSFKIYLESLFEVGMTWENYGYGDDKWHIDHIMPCAIFDLSKPEHQKRCFHFSNMRPMWQPDNFSKGDKIITNQFNLL